MRQLYPAQLLIAELYSYIGGGGAGFFIEPVGESWEEALTFKNKMGNSIPGMATHAPFSASWQ